MQSDSGIPFLRTFMPETIYMKLLRYLINFLIGQIYWQDVIAITFYVYNSTIIITEA